MKIVVECPAGHRMKVPRHRANTEIRCAQCGAVTRVGDAPPPALSEMPASPAVGEEESGGGLASVWGAEPAVQEELSEAESSGPATSPLEMSLADVLGSDGSATIALPAQFQGPVRGYEASPERVAVAGHLAAGLVVLAVLGLFPCLQAVLRVIAVQDAGGIPKWVFAVTLVSFLQIIYAIYIGQLPDWSSAWVVSLVLLGVTAAYGIVLSLSVLGSSESELAQFLEIGDLVRNNLAARWCMVMMLASLGLTFACGWLGLRWRRAYRTVIAAQYAP